MKLSASVSILDLLDKDAAYLAHAGVRDRWRGGVGFTGLYFAA